MHKITIALVGAGVLALAGCQSTVPVKAEAPQAVAKPQEAPKAQLTEEAKQALAQAEADVHEAQAKKALWTNAQDALKDAKAAAAKNDSAAVIKHAKQASEFARLGIEQTKYPVTSIGK